MKNSNNLKYLVNLTLRCLMLCMVSLAPLYTYALPGDFYARSSRLAEGTWRKVKINSDGVVFISNAQLRTMGFKDPTKVNVYGYGGRPLSDKLDSSMADDLPLQLSLHTDTGIIFFGTGTVAWSGNGSQSFPYTHSQNLYGSESYYFLSDREIDITDSEEPDYTNLHGKDISTFTETILHENEIEGPGNTGAMFYGEDFRNTPTRAFKFNLPGKIGDTVEFRVAFAAKTTNGASTLTFTVNGETLESSPSDQILAVTSTDMMARIGTTTKELAIPGNEMNLGISYSHSGVVYLARLDYIYVNYNRQIDMSDGQLLFSLNQRTSDYIVNVTNASTTTQIWDVTDPVAPQRIKFFLDGTTAKFTPGKAGYCRFMAFEPSKIQATVTTGLQVKNQDLHAMEVPDMVIVSPKEYISEAKRLATHHEEADGMKVHILTPEEIYNEFSSGGQDITAIRKALKMWYDRGEENGHRLRYCLLFGRGFYDNRRISEAAKLLKYPTLPIWQHPTGLTEATTYSTDDYYGFLSDNETDLRMESEKLCIGVGRMPVKSISEARQAVDKAIAYASSTDFGEWRNQIMLIADDQDQGVHLDQAETVYSGMVNSGNGQDFIYEKLYLDAYEMKFSGTGNTYPEATNRMLKLYNEGVMFVDYIGHGAPKSWGHESLWTYTQISQMKNKRLPFYLTATCSFGKWDDLDPCGAEELWLNPTGGGIAFISASRVSYITANGILNRKMTENMLMPLSDGSPKRFGDIIREGKNGIESSDDNKLRFMLLGDPALKLPVPEYKVITETINGVNMSDPAVTVELAARSKVNIKGYIADKDGNPVIDFNGTLIPTLFDAEKVIETNGNGGDEGKVALYNDYKNILFKGNVEVKNGYWETDFIIPLEIENNYSPAKIAYYGFSKDGKEANGSTTRLYVYGIDDSADEDREGPVIDRFVINSDTFKEGDAVNPDPIVLASVKDPSGINISTVGIGHQLTLTLDDTRIYDDVSSYFSVFPGDSSGGEIRYQISSLQPGDHTLTLSVWDNVGNSSRQSIRFKVSENAIPVLYDVIPDSNPATTSVTFHLLHDSPGGEVASEIEIFDLNGTKIWSGSTGSGTDASVTWDLTVSGGQRVPRGIYLYRATVKSADGVKSTKTKKIAVAAK